MANLDLNYTPQPRQLVFHTTKARQILYGGCVSGDTEFLTPSGWKRIDQYEDGDKIADFTPVNEGDVEFVEPRQFVDFPCEEMWRFQSKRMDMLLSDDHRCLVFNWEGRLRVSEASRLAAKPSRHWVPVTFRPKRAGLPFTDDEIRLGVAIHADGSFDGCRENYCRVSLRKNRKKERLEMLLDRLGIKWKVRGITNRPTEFRYSFDSPITTKNYDSWWGATPEQLSIIIDEMSHWDGHYSGATGGEICFSTVNKRDADFMQYAAHATGHIATIGVTKRKKVAHRDLYRVHIERKATERGVSLRNREGNKGTKITREKVERMYCFETSTGFWVARRNDKIFITGNSAGGGKSHSLRWDLIRWCLKCPGIDTYLFRRTLGELEDNHIRKIRSEIPAELGKYREQKKRFEFKNGSGINFCYCEREADVERYQGAEIHVLGIDEAAHLTSYQINYLRTRVRLGSFNVPEEYEDYLPRIMFGSNPGGPGHNFLKETFIDPAPAEEIFFDDTMKPPDSDEDGWPTIFIPASMQDNKYLDASYAGQFNALPPELAKALRDGDWDAVVGQALHNLSKQRHLLRPFVPPKHWTRFMSMDWGSAKPFSVGWYCVSDGAILAPQGKWPEMYLPAGAVIRYDEYYGWNGSANEGNRMDSGSVARKILLLEDERKDVMDYRIGDSQMWAVTDGPSIAEKMLLSTDGRLAMRRSEKDRKANYAEMISRLAGNPEFRDNGKEEQHPMFFATANCRHFWRTVPTLVLDKTDPEKGPETLKSEDHVYDDVVYGLRSRPYILTKEDRWYTKNRKHMKTSVDPYAV